MLRTKRRAQLDVDLCDAGGGITQLLPVLTGLALAVRWKLGGPPILAVEEPESHLHPRLQRALTARLCSVAASDQAVRLVLETHSEQVLLGVKLEIARGRIDPEDVLVYWVHQLESGESIAEPVRFDREAQPIGSWPPGFFDDHVEVAREILEARQAIPAGR